MNIELKVLNKEFYNDRPLPGYSTAGSAAIDLVCTEDFVIYPGETKLIKTGIAIWIESGAKTATTVVGRESISEMTVAGVIIPRSGLGSKGLILANIIGLIDEDYQGELLVQVWNRNSNVGWEDFYLDEDTREMWLGTEPYRVLNSDIKLKAGDRFAQLLFTPVIKANFNIVEQFSNVTDRGEGGYGSTGI